MTVSGNSPAPLLELRKVSRQRGGRPAVRDLSLRLDRGDVLGLLGVNGAGKSTTLAMMTAALSPHAGQVLIDGMDLAEYPGCVRQRVGWLPERAPLYDELTVDEQLGCSGRLHGLRGNELQERRADVLAKLDLEPMRKRLIRQLSQGQRQRVGLACALLHDPPLLILDEPGNGLDPVQIGQWHALVNTLADGHAVVISTHVLDDVSATCNRVAILHEGMLRHEGAIDADTRALQKRFMDIATQSKAASA